MMSITPGWSRHRQMFLLAVPATATLVADPIMGLVDTAVVGRLGAAELGGLGLAVAVFSAGSWIFNFLVYGTTSAVAKAVGAGDREVAGRRVAHAAQVALVLGLAVGGFLLVTAPWLLQAVGAVDELLDPATTYLRIRAVGVVLLLLGFVGHGAFRGVSDTRTPLLIAVAANVVNAVLTFWFVLGLGWGIAGAAWATVVAEAVVVLAFLVLLARTRLPVAGHGRPTWLEVRELLAVSRDLVLRTAGLVFGFMAIAAGAARIDAPTAAAYQVIHQTTLVVSFLMDGLAIAGQAMVGTALGAGDRDEAKATSRVVLGWGVVGGVVLAGLLLAGSGLLPRVLTDDPGVLDTVASGWWLFAIGLVLAGPVYALDGVLMGAEDYRFLRNTTVLSGVVGGVAAQLVATGGGGLIGIVLAKQLLIAVRFVALVVRARGDRWLTAARPAAEPPPTA